MRSRIVRLQPVAVVGSTRAAPLAEAGGGQNERGPDFALIELLFFAYRDFVGEPDRLLAPHGFGRAHHRVLHFVNRHRGLTIAELLDILQITKQSLARVLKDLVAAGFIEQRSGNEDRRQRRLFPTEQGERLARSLATAQSARIARGLAAAGAQNRTAVERFLAGLIDEPSGLDGGKA